MSASMPFSAKKRLVSSGYSLETFTPWGSSLTLLTGESCGTPTTMRTGLEVALEYWSSPRDSTWLEVSSTQSRPVMPRSNSPSATYCGISCGRRMRTSATRGSSMEALYCTAESRETFRSAASNSSRVAFSREPLGRTSFNMSANLPPDEKASERVTGEMHP